MASERPSPEVDDVEVARILTEGAIEIEGRITNSSNATLVVTVTSGSTSITGVYKPERGERPLWDFPAGLWRREVAAYELSRAFDAGLIPVTVVRVDGPFGVGSLQAYVDEDGISHYFTMAEDPQYADVLQTLAAFDVVANNSDRKSGHVLLADGCIAGIDHGLCFHEEDKLRTVIWDFAGEPLTERATCALERLVTEGLPPLVGELLSPTECAATTQRAAALLESGILPAPDEDRPWPPYPWPLV